MLIIAGKLYVAPEACEAHLATYSHFIRDARTRAGCLDFVIAADPIEAERVNLLECWESEEHLAAFRAIAAPPASAAGYSDVQVSKHLIEKSGPAFD